MSADPRTPGAGEPHETVVDETVARIYRDAAAAQLPPPELRAAVLEMARIELERRPRGVPWLRPMALAASLLLGLGLLMNLWRDPTAQRAVVLRQVPAPATAQAPFDPGAAAPREADADADADAERRPDAEPPRRDTESHASPASPANPVEAGRLAAPQRVAPPPQGVAATPPTPEPSASGSSPPAPAVAAPWLPTAGPAALESTVPAAATAPAALGATVAGLLSKASAPDPSRSGPMADTAASSARVRGFIKAERRERPWRTPEFQGLVLGEATREQVWARLGAPLAQGISYPRPEAVDRRDLPYDYYERIPGVEGGVKLYYDRWSPVLEAVRVALPEPLTPEAVQARLGWEGSRLLGAGSADPCSEQIPQDDEYPRFHAFPERGAYLVERAPGQVQDLVYERSCP